jgi:DNA-binding NarL/FixJ family response regulator
MAEPAERVIKVLAVDDNPVNRARLRRLLERARSGLLVDESANGVDALHAARRFQPDVVLFGALAPSAYGAKVLPELARGSRVVILAHDANPDAVADATRQGATGYVVQEDFDPDQMRRAVVDAYHGRTYLSPSAASALVQHVTAMQMPRDTSRLQARFRLSGRETEVMNEIVRGMTNAEIAARLVLSEKTIKNHVNRLFRKLGVRSRASAIALWLGTAGPQVSL